MLWPIILFATWPFWLLILALIIWDWYSLHHESGTGAFLGLVAFFAILTVFTDLRFDWLFWLGKHFELVVAFIIANYVLGAGWAFVEFTVFYARKRADDFEARKTYLVAHYNPEDSHWDSKIRESRKFDTFKEYMAVVHDFPPQMWNHKARFISVATWWIFSFLDTMLFDAIYRLYEMAYYWMAEQIQRRIDKLFSSRFAEFRDDYVHPKTKRQPPRGAPPFVRSEEVE